MTRSHSRRFLVILLLAPLAAACGSAATTGPQQPQPARDERSAAELEAIYRARIDSSRTRYTAADVHFISGMVHHHAQAIEMARYAAANTGSSSIRTLAARIDNAQRDEIARMQQWLRDRGQPVPELHITDAHVMVEGGAHHTMQMPGMLTPEQLQELARAEGQAFDRLFLTYMIQHHAGAVVMVDTLFATDGAAQDEDAFRLASDIRVDQATEVARMERMLAAMSAGGG